jgi:hypothetical protein
MKLALAVYPTLLIFRSVGASKYFFSECLVVSQFRMGRRALMFRT